MRIMFRSEDIGC